MENQNKQKSLIERLVTNAQVTKDYDEVAEYLLRSSMLPKHLKDSKTAKTDIMLVIDHGMSIGLTWSEALSGLIPKGDGKFIMKGDLAKALVMASGKLSAFDVSYSGKIEDNTRACKVKAARADRENESPFLAESIFGLQDAIRAELYTPGSVVKSYYKTYPDRTIYYRAMGFVFRDLFSDILKNITFEEEFNDFKGVGEQEVDAKGNVFKFPDAEAKNTKTTKSVDAITKDLQTSGFKLLWYYNAEGDTQYTGPADGDNTDPVIGEFIVGNDAEGERYYEAYKAKLAQFEEEKGSEEEIRETDAPTTILWTEELQKQLSKLNSAGLQKWMAEELPGVEEYIETLGQIQKKTVKSMLPIIEAYLESPDSAELYLQKTYPDFYKEEEEQEEQEDVKPKTAPPTPSAKPQKEEQIQMKKAPLPPSAKPAEKTEGGNKFGISIPEIDVKKGGRDMKQATVEIFIPLSNLGKFEQFEKLFEDNFSDSSFETADDFLIQASEEQINDLINALD